MTLLAFLVASAFAAPLTAPLECEGRVHPDDRYGTVYECTDPAGKKLKIQNEYEEGFTGTIRLYDKAGKLTSIRRYTKTKQDGIQEEFFENGALKRRETMIDGKNDGPFESYEKPGVPSRKGVYEAGEEREIRDYRDGKLRQVMRYGPGGRKQGLSEVFHGNGNPDWRASYVDDRRHGRQETFWENGKPKYVYQFLDDKEHGLHSEFHQNGQLSRESCYQGGRVVEDMSLCKPSKKDGDVKEFFADGKVRVLTQFKGGKKHGRYELNHEGGKSRVKGQYSSGEPSGTWEFRDEQGRLEEKKIYAGKNWRKEAYFVETGKLSQEQDWVDGRPAREKRYWENGKLRFDRAKAPDKSSVYRAYDREGRLEEEGRTVYRELSYSGWFPSFYMDDGWGLWSSFAYRFSNDVLDGPRVYHYSDGSKSAEKFKEGRPDGVWTDYDPKGRVVSEHVYAAGVLTEERDFKHGKLSETRKIAKDGSVLSTTKKSSPPPSSI